MVYEDEFIKYGAKVIEKRLEYVQKISIILNLNYRKLFDNKKELSLSYECHLGNIKKLSLKEIEKLLREKIKKNFSQEKRYGFSLCGPQKDDFLFILNGKIYCITRREEINNLLFKIVRDRYGNT